MNAWNGKGLPPEGMAIIALGGNEGDVEKTFKYALEGLRANGFELVSASSLYSTKPIGCEEGAKDFLNAVVIGRWRGAAQELLFLCKDLEKEAGRPALHPHWISRPLDLDIVAFGRQEISDGILSIPHPLALKRRFVLAPLAEILPDLRLPGTLKTVKEALAALPPDDGEVFGQRPFVRPGDAPVLPKIGTRGLWAFRILAGCLALAGLFVLLMGGCAYFSFRHARACSATPPRIMVCRPASLLMPPTATKIEYEGIVAVGWVSWKCQVPEGAFLDFAKKNGWELSPKMTKENFIGILTFYKPAKLFEEPASAWYYSKRESDGGGVSIMYDRTSQTEYGQTSNR